MKFPSLLVLLALAGLVVASVSARDVKIKMFMGKKTDQGTYEVACTDQFTPVTHTMAEGTCVMLPTSGIPVPETHMLTAKITCDGRTSASSYKVEAYLKAKANTPECTANVFFEKLHVDLKGHGASQCFDPLDPNQILLKATLGASSAANILAVQVDCGEPVDCEASYGGFGSCSATCGEGFRKATLVVKTPASGGGKACPPPERIEKCPGLSPCPVDCVEGPWQDFGVCSTTCGDGQQRQTRALTLPLHGGKACGVSEQFRKCNEGPCPVDCKYAWGDWSSCSVTCGSGVQTRNGSIATKAAHGGKACTEVSPDTRTCETNIECPVDCEHTPYSNWDTCSEPCGGGIQTRRMTITRPASAGGKACPKEVETKKCNTEACSKDCKQSSWSEWTKCSKSCGGGVRSHHRTVIAPKAGDGAPCGAANETEPCNTHPCPVDCKLENTFGNWSTCSHSCGSAGTMFRDRAVLRKDENGGLPCLNKRETAPCNRFPCPVDCQVSDFGGWSECSRNCGYGTRYKSRTVLKHAENGGAVCPKLTVSEKCIIKACPHADPNAPEGVCSVGPWGNWSTCTNPCDGGFSSRRREVIKKGKLCPFALAEHRRCNTFPCAHNCTVRDWSEWTKCTASCGGGTQTRKRSVRHLSTDGGATCKALLDVRDCNAHNCNMDCSAVKFTEWSPCSKSCGGGTSTRTPVPSEIATKCGVQAETWVCNAQPCPEACEMGPFSPWSNCTAHCGEGRQSRQRKILKPARYNAPACPAVREDRICHTAPCPRDCQVSQWSAPSKCNAACGVGTRTFYRNVTHKAIGSGKTCPTLVKHVPCELAPCHTECKWGNYSAWSNCTAACGHGTQFQTRVLLNKSDTHSCGSTKLVRSCFIKLCKGDKLPAAFFPPPAPSKPSAPHEPFTVPPVVTSKPFEKKTTALLHFSADFLAYFKNNSQVALQSDVVQSLGDKVSPSQLKVVSVSKFQAKIEIAASNTTTPTSIVQEIQRQLETIGSPLSTGTSSRLATLVTSEAAPRDCIATQMSEWSECSAKCQGTAVRVREIVQTPLNGGKPCPELKEFIACNTNCTLDADCQVSHWGPWGNCSAPCGGGTQTHSRTVLKPATGRGNCSFNLTESRPCNTKACPVVNCKYSSYSKWSDCSVSCGGGVRHRNRSIVHKEANGGKACNLTTLKVSEPCNIKACAPQDCVYSDWSKYAPCSKSCGDGVQTRNRTIKSQALHEGKPCNTSLLVEVKTCNLGSCPHKDCEYTSFSSWSPCMGEASVSCDGVQQRHRQIKAEPIGAGKPCNKSTLAESRHCTISGCKKQDCSYKSWSSWSKCTVSCGGGTQFRHREIEKPGLHGGVMCNDTLLHEVRPCNTDHCQKKDCEYGEWSKFSPCSASCGDGTHTRHREIKAPPANGGKPCDDTQTFETAKCNMKSCAPAPVDCVVSEWSEWSKCEKATQHRTRTVTKKAAYGGKACPETTQKQACSNTTTPTSCECQCPCECCPHPAPTPAPTPAPVKPECKYSDWSQWTSCSASCGGGVQTRTRKLTQGSHCHDKLSEQQQCGTSTCPGPHKLCEYHRYGPWSRCARTCKASGVSGMSASTGNKGVTRRVAKPMPNGPMFCDDVVQEKPCDLPVGYGRTVIPVLTNKLRLRRLRHAPCVQSKFF